MKILKNCFTDEISYECECEKCGVIFRSIEPISICPKCKKIKQIRADVISEVIKYAEECGVTFVECGQDRENEERQFSMTFEDWITELK